MTQRITIGALFAWLLVAVYYLYQYALRSAPSVMMPQLSEAFGVTTLGAASIVGMFYYGYSPFSLVAGAAIDRFGAKRIIPIGAALVGVGALLFGTGNSFAAAALSDSGTCYWVNDVSTSGTKYGSGAACTGTAAQAAAGVSW
jgi:sugar phosphate permease